MDPALSLDAQPEPGSGPPSGASSLASDALARPGDAYESIESLVVVHQAAMLRYARHLLGGGAPAGEADAQDLVQDAFLRLHRQRAQRGAASVAQPKAWLLRVTHNLAMDLIRKRTRRKVTRLKLQRDARARQEQADRSPPPGQLELENREAAQHALDLMKHLPDNQQRVLLLRLQDMTVRQIAEVLDMTPGNVGYHLNQAMTTLARQLKQAQIV